MPQIRHCPPSEHHYDRNLNNKGLKREHYNQKQFVGIEAKKGLIIEGKLFVGLPMPSCFRRILGDVRREFMRRLFGSSWRRGSVYSLCFAWGPQCKRGGAYFHASRIEPCLFSVLNFWFLLLSFKPFLGIRGGPIDTWTRKTVGLGGKRIVSVTTIICKGKEYPPPHMICFPFIYPRRSLKKSFTRSAPHLGLGPRF
jgi:hypothetical protein